VYRVILLFWKKTTMSKYWLNSAEISKKWKKRKIPFLYSLFHSKGKRKKNGKKSLIFRLKNRLVILLKWKEKASLCLVFKIKIEKEEKEKIVCLAMQNENEKRVLFLKYFFIYLVVYENAKKK